MDKVSELSSTQQFVSYIMVRTVAFKWTDDEICFVLDKDA